MTDNEYNILAAAMGNSNLGFEKPTEEQFTRLLRKEKISLFEAVEFFSRQHMEGEDHLQMFMDEAEGWKLRLQKRKDEDLKTEWPYEMGIFLRSKKQVQPVTR